MTGGPGPWLRTLASGGIAAVGLAVLFASWPEDEVGRQGAYPGDPWTVAVNAGWCAELPEPPLEDPGDSLAADDPEREDESDGRGAPAEIPAGFVSYTVVKKDSLWRIAERELGSPRRLGEIERANAGIAGRPLIPGMRILLPSPRGAPGAVDLDPAPAPSPAGKVRRHSVGKGETLSRIGERYGVSAEAIFAANRDQLRSKDQVRAGAKLRIPPAEGGVR